MKTTDKFLTRIAVLTILLGCLFPAPTAQSQEIALDHPEAVQSSTAAGTTIANSISPAGPTVAFVSDADDLVPNDHNQGKLDVFVRDLETGKTTLVSVNASGESSGNGDSNYPIISSDARYVVFESKADDLVENDVNNVSDVFIRDLADDTTALISSTLGEGDPLSESQLLAATADAGYVAFKKSDATLDRVEDNLPGWKLCVYQRKENTTTLITQNATDGTAASLWPRPIALSSETATLAFLSLSPDLSDQPLPEELEGLNLPHLYVKNLDSGEIQRIDPQQYAPDIPTDELQFLEIGSITLSGNGEVLVISLASRRIPIYWIRYDLLSETTVEFIPEDIGLGQPVFALCPAVSRDGNSSVVLSINRPYDPPLFYWYDDGALVEHEEFTEGFTDSKVENVLLSADGRKVLLDDQLYDRGTREWKSILPESAGLDEQFPSFGALADPDLNYILFHGQNGSLAGGDGNQAVDAFLYDAAEDSIQAVSLRHPDSPPSLRNGLRVSWTDVSPNDVVQYKNDLSRENWNDLQAEINSEDSAGSVVDPSAGLFSRRFYRVLRGD